MRPKGPCASPRKRKGATCTVTIRRPAPAWHLRAATTRIVSSPKWPWARPRPRSPVRTNHPLARSPRLLAIVESTLRHPSRQYVVEARPPHPWPTRHPPTPPRRPPARTGRLLAQLSLPKVAANMRPIIHGTSRASYNERLLSASRASPSSTPLRQQAKVFFL